ncbi:glycosyltransferase family 39 protein [Breznakiella homolactica]|uniref:Glycosyltransferase family 39 protein n=1 Tax=Breznakiella homolactica TaxID=2798577 RepID=A0A7T7XNG1_9SPIR|nr:glycosyltransferase family 39 protein [Breznakiella homolactica]QQO09457.1 glycosyltransferase family 39 protein [Breznakiella homolactica]
MSKPVKIVLTLTCAVGVLLSAGISAYLQIDGNRTVFGEWLAPVHINVEIDKQYTHRIAVYSEPGGSTQFYYLNPTTVVSDESSLQNIILHGQLRTNGLHRRLYLCFPDSFPKETVAAVDNISVFIGNRLVYFSKEDIRQFDFKTKDGYHMYRIPSLYYTKSLLVKDWVNYYGDFNIALKIIPGFFVFPFNFFLSYLFLFGLIYLYRNRLREIYTKFRQTPNKWFGPVALVIIILIGFALRINGFVRHSGWSDELYSATIAGNPTLPFIETFTDPGNPPFYFILLRAWFMLFGWTEVSGTLLSVLLGTAAIPVLYILVKKYFGRNTAILAAFLMAISGFAVDYSQEMRAYILKIFLVPVITYFFLEFINRQSLKDLILYSILCILIVNAHYYGILLVMANFIFYCLYMVSQKRFIWKKGLFFFLGNCIIAVSFLPFFFYQISVKKYFFERDFPIQPDFLLLLAIIAVLAAILFIYRKKLNLNRILPSSKGMFFSYTVYVPIALFVLAFFVSLVRPMLAYKYLLPITFPFFISLIAMMLTMARRHHILKYGFVFLLWAAAASLYTGQARIPGGGYGSYKESRAYIAADAAAHSDKKSAMLDPAPDLAQYYGFDVMSAYEQNESFDVLYVFNRAFRMNEYEMYSELSKYNLTDENTLKIYPNDEVVVFKKILSK